MSFREKKKEKATQWQAKKNNKENLDFSNAIVQA